ncbi:MAG: DUF370 domain-containing protein [Oscillospiraceae bacterium]|nr:DUF370 domain-containing protein [Oscillospiraceae bacterium]
MYLHIGNHYYVRKQDILGIFDMDNATYSYRTRETLNRAEKAGSVINAAENEIPNSFVLCRDGDETKIYLSMVTAQTLLRRAEEHLF